MPGQTGSRAVLLDEGRHGTPTPVATKWDGVAESIRDTTPGRPPQRCPRQRAMPCVSTASGRLCRPQREARSRNLRLAESQFSMCCALSFPSGKGPGVGARKSRAKTQTDAWFRFFVSTNPSVAPQKRGGGFADATLCEKQQPRRQAPITPLWPAAHTRPQKLPPAGFSPMLQSTQSSLVLPMCVISLLRIIFSSETVHLFQQNCPHPTPP